VTTSVNGCCATSFLFELDRGGGYSLEALSMSVLAGTPVVLGTVVPSKPALRVSATAAREVDDEECDVCNRYTAVRTKTARTAAFRKVSIVVGGPGWAGPFGGFGGVGKEGGGRRRRESKGDNEGRSRSVNGSKNGSLRVLHGYLRQSQMH